MMFLEGPKDRRVELKVRHGDPFHRRRAEKASIGRGKVSESTSSPDPADGRPALMGNVTFSDAWRKGQSRKEGRIRRCDDCLGEVDKRSRTSAIYASGSGE